MSIPSAAGLVEALRTNQVLDQVQLERVQRTLQTGAADARALARELLKEGSITAYQANLLLQGRGAELVLGPYVLLERLGEGGMGQVFKARHQLMNRIVAVKVIRKELLTSSDAVQRFHREIRLAAQLDHPHLVRAHDAAQVGDTHFLVMEYAEGTDLQRLVDKSGRLPLAQACEYIRQAALGLQHASERGLVHRDVKPSNLQLTAQGSTVKILDMGLARSQAADGIDGAGAGLTQARTVMGTPDYIAPEQIADARSADIRADIYSLGCTLYFLLAGKPPFPTGAWEEKLVCHRKVEPKPIEQLRPEVSAAIGAVLRKMMAKRPDDRYATPAAAADALAPFCGKTETAAGGATAESSPAPIGAAETVGWAPTTPDSLINQPGSREPGWTLEVEAPVAPAPPPSALTPARPPAGPTLLAPAPQVPTTAQPLHGIPPQQLPADQKWFRLAVAGGVVSVCELILLIIVLWPKGGESAKSGTEQQAKVTPSTAAGNKDTSKSGEATVFIDENFTKPPENSTLPLGWKGEAYRIGKYVEKPCLERSGPAGIKFVKLPSMNLSKDFYVEGEALLTHPTYATFTMHLESSKGKAPMRIVIAYSGNVTFNEDPRATPANYKAGSHTHFSLTRQGKTLIMKLNTEPLGNKELNEITEYDTVSLSYDSYTMLFRLKIATLP